MEENRKKSKNCQDLKNAAQTGAAAEIVQRYGYAIKEHDVAYRGIDNETGRRLKRGLRKTAQSKVNDSYKKTNIKQQAGYSAEDKYVAKQNAERIVKGEKIKVSRTDDLNSSRYKVNDPLVDIVSLDKDGLIIEGSQLQMKFVGNTPKECLTKLMSRKLEKYIDNDIPFTIPHDYYDEVLAEADNRISRYERQLERIKGTKPDTADGLRRKIEKLKKIRSTAKDSGITTKEAIFAREHPILSTAKDVAKLSHRAGVEQAKTGAGISAVVSLIKNTVLIVQKKKSVKEAAGDLCCDTIKGAAVGYATGAAGSAIKGVMQNSSKSAVRSLSKTNLPAIAVTATYEIGNSMYDWLSGSISGEQCLKNIGEEGANQLSSALFATIGQMAIPIPIVGAMAGSMIGYAMSQWFYKELMGALQDAQTAKEQRLEVEAYCKEVVSLIDEYSAEMARIQETYFSSFEHVFNDAFAKIDDALDQGNYEELIENANNITQSMDGNVQFTTVDEFTEIFNNVKPLKI